MAETLEENIVISATGGDDAAAQVQQVNRSFQAVNTTHDQLKDAFAHRFEHIGLRMFAGQLLQTNGLSAEARPIISTLMLSINSLAGAFGLAGGEAMLVVAALVALAGITVAVINHHKNEYDAIQKTTDARAKEMTGIEGTISALDKYATAGGHLTNAQTELLKASQALESHLRAEQIVTLGKAITLIEAQRMTIISHATALAAWHSLWLDIKKAVEDILAPFTKVLDSMKAMAATVASFAPTFASFSSGLKMSAKDTDALNLALQENAKLLAQKKADLEALKNGFNVMGDAAIAAATKEAEGRRKVENQLKADINAEHAHERASMDSLIDANIKARQQEAKETIRITKEMASQMGRDVGDAFAKMIVEGKSFTEEMQAAFTRMAEQIISDIIRIIIEQEILLALETATGTAGGGSYWGGAMAGGGSVVVDKPTMFLAGEAGPEMATFTPLGSSGSSGGGGAGSIGAVNISLNVGSIQGNDPAGTLSMLAEEIRRETAPARQFAATVSGVAARYPKQAY